MKEEELDIPFLYNSKSSEKEKDGRKQDKTRFMRLNLYALPLFT